MGQEQKLTAVLDGHPLVSYAVSAALGSRADPVLVVVRDGEDDVGPGFPDDVVTVSNPLAEEGLSTSLKAGIQALPSDVSGAVILLGDMPRVSSADIDHLIGAFRPDAPCVPLVEGRWGNPVLWPKAFFSRIFQIDGDRGARTLLEELRPGIVEVELQNRGLLLDVDTPEQLEQLRRHGTH